MHHAICRQRKVPRGMLRERRIQGVPLSGEIAADAIGNLELDDLRGARRQRLQENVVFIARLAHDQKLICVVSCKFVYRLSRHRVPRCENHRRVFRIVSTGKGSDAERRPPHDLHVIRLTALE